MRPLKTSKRNGNVIYHVDSDDDEPAKPLPRDQSTTATDGGNNDRESDIEEVTLL